MFKKITNFVQKQNYPIISFINFVLLQFQSKRGNCPVYHELLQRDFFFFSYLENVQNKSNNFVTNY